MTEQLIGIIVAGLLGAVIGSFENVLIIRWHDEAPIGGRSHCMGCKKTLRPQHLVPIFSWLWLGGRCADCGKRIHVQYPLVEAAGAVFAIVAALRHSPFSEPLPFAFEFLFTVGLLVPIVMDIRWKELPVEYLVGFGVVGGGMRIAMAIMGGADAVRAALFILLAVAGTAAFFGLQFLLSRGKWVGEGDIWFGAMMGAALGTPMFAAVGVYLSYLVGGTFALVGLVSGTLKRGSRIPFAPALAAGTILTIWHGERLLAWIAPFSL